jgi:D-amino peptidase
MKIYISADIEGVTGVTTWAETDLEKPACEPARRQMTAEVAAACEGAFAAGATEVLVKDAHDTAMNLIPELLPKGVELIRGWSDHPLAMLQEIDESFDALMLIGFHARARAGASPLEHTLFGQLTEVRLNSQSASEFTFATFTAAACGVPTVLLSGDAGICAEASAFVPGITTVPVKRGAGASTISIHPELACERIREAAEAALGGNPASCQIDLPDRFVLELDYRRHARAYRASFYPGAVLSNSTIVRFESSDLFEVLRAMIFMLP